MARATPTFAVDPYGWFTRLSRAVGSDEWPELLRTIEVDVWVGEAGNAWRVMRSTHGIEVRPSLISPFIRFGDLPRVTAIALGEVVEVELTCRDRRWIDRFPLGGFDVAALGHVMLDERELPHDNLPRLFPPDAEPPAAHPRQDNRRAPVGPGMPSAGDPAAMPSLQRPAPDMAKEQ
jgi:hypothetical protein